MKQVVKINEAQLRGIVAESVKNILSELDWKTYMNAARKAQERLNNNNNRRNYAAMTSRFQQAARDAFNQQYGYNDNNGNKVELQTEPGYDSRPAQGGSVMAQVSGGNQDGRYLGQVRTNIAPRSDFSGGTRSELYQYDKTGNHEIEQHPNGPLVALSQNRGIQDKYIEANGEHQNYLNGRYHYDPAKGWQLNEAQLKKIVAESIQKVLRNNA